ncbi:unnamed protein product [Caenorhabditis angaria]|uniref:G-protein coupled receptors family 1 profile domain-containing protein n=1 Tax=Caenorhabditis angaria TaxID=860376 RepID=A0A9P1MUZ1_9PELO|nr:unnamed protein product [Caenorhabditis angaria]
MSFNSTENSTYIAVDDPDAYSLIDETFIRYPIIIAYIFVFVVCLFGNLLTILVITTHPLMKTATNFFLANLAAADLLVAIFCILQNMIHIVGFNYGHWPLGEVLCKLYLSVLHMVPCTSVGILLCVSLEKYIAVLHPLTALKILTHRLRVTVTISIWIGSILLNSPFFLYAKLIEYPDGSNACYREKMPVWVTVSFFIWYTIPVFVLAGIYLRIGRLLWITGSNRTSTRQSSDSQGSLGKSLKLANGRVIVFQQESLLNVPQNNERKSTNKRPKDTEGRRKVVRLLFAVVLSFAILTLPQHARLLYTSWSSNQLFLHQWTFFLQPVSYILLFVSSAINPILYALLSKRFRDAVSDVIHCRKGVFSKMSRSRNRTLVSDVPGEDSRCPSPHIGIRMQRLRQLQPQ